MGVTCNHCSRVINKKYPGVKCRKCLQSFHALCVGLSDNHLEILQIEAIAWFCPDCHSSESDKLLLQNVSEQKTPTDKNELITMSKIKLLLNSMKSELVSEIDKKLNLIVQSVDFCSNKITDFEKDLKHINEKIKMTELSTKLNDLEQHSKLNNIVISNCPENKNENIYEIVKTIGTCVGTAINDCDLKT